MLKLWPYVTDFKHIPRKILIRMMLVIDFASYNLLDRLFSPVAIIRGLSRPDVQVVVCSASNNGIGCLNLGTIVGKD